MTPRGRKGRAQTGFVCSIGKGGSLRGLLGRGGGTKWEGRSPRCFWAVAGTRQNQPESSEDARGSPGGAGGGKTRTPRSAASGTRRREPWPGPVAARRRLGSRLVWPLGTGRAATGRSPSELWGLSGTRPDFLSLEPATELDDSGSDGPLRSK